MGDNDGGIGTTITDQGDEGDDGTLANATFSTSVPEEAEYSVSFDGTNDSISVSSALTYITENAAFSLSFWMNPSGYGSNGTYANVLGFKSDYDSKNFAINFNDDDTGYQGLSFGITNYATPGISAKYHTSGILGDSLLNKWSQVVITYNGSGLATIGNWKLYIDGSSTTIAGASGWYDSGTLENTIGNYRGYHWEGLIDELAFWDATLSADDADSIYNSGSPNDLDLAASYDTDRTSNLIGWWRMGDGTEAGTGTTVYDMSDNNNEGTLNNGATFSTDAPS
jgi:hypothetical protein